MLPSGLGASDGTVAGPLLFSNALSSSHSCSVLRTAVLEYPEFWLRLAPLHNDCSRRCPRPCRTEREVPRSKRCGQVMRFLRSSWSASCSWREPAGAISSATPLQRHRHSASNNTQPGWVDFLRQGVPQAQQIGVSPDHGSFSQYEPGSPPRLIRAR